MSNIHYLKTYKSDPNNRSMVTDELIDKLYDFAPRNVFYWVLKFFIQNLNLSDLLLFKHKVTT